MMKKSLLVAGLLLLLGAAAPAQQIRTNYRSGGITHISTEYEAIKLGGADAELRVELAGFPDGSTLYLVYLNLMEKTATNVPKGVKMAATLNNGKILRLEQIGEDSPTKRRLDNGLFVNRLKYAVETPDMEKMVRTGVKSIDIVTGWNPDDFVQATFPSNQMSELLKAHCEAILKAADSTIDLEASLAGYTENANSVMVTANPLVARGQNCDYNVILSHLYYKNNNQEDVDVALVVGSKQQFHIPYDAPVHFLLRDGSEITLGQTRDDVNFVCVYPSMEEMDRMVREGIAGLRIECEGAVLEDSFPVDAKADDGTPRPGLTEIFNQELQLLLSLSAR